MHPGAARPRPPSPASRHPRAIGPFFAVHVTQKAYIKSFLNEVIDLNAVPGPSNKLGVRNPQKPPHRVMPIVVTKPCSVYQGPRCLNALQLPSSFQMLTS